MIDSDPQRILMTADTVGGVWTYALELSEALGKRGIEVLLVTFGVKASERQRDEASRVPNLLLIDSSYKLEWMADPWQEVEASRDWLSEIAHGYHPDVVHLNSYGHGALPWKVPVLLTAHSCVLSWFQAVRGSAAPHGWERYREEVKRCLESVDLLVTPSRAMLRAVEQNYGGNLPLSRVVLNARNPARYRPAAKEPFVLTAGRLWDEAKNVGAVARAAASLRWPCYVAGEQRHPDGGAASFAGCRMLGPLAPDELSGWYARAAIYALPARYEPFGLSALEAALAGCALVLGDIESLHEIWGDAAIFVPSDDETALVSAIAGLIGNREQREELARRSSVRARAYTSERMASEYLDAYRWAASHRRQACAS